MVVSGKVRKIAFEVWVRPRVATFFRFNKTLSMTGRKLFSVLTMAATVYERENVRRYSQSSDTLSLLFDFFLNYNLLIAPRKKASFHLWHYQ